MDYGSFLCDFFLTIYWFIIPATMVKGCRYNLFVQFTISLSNGFTSYFHRMKINYEIKFEWRQRNERMKKRVYEWMMRSNTKNIIWCVKKAIWTSYTVCSYCFLNNPWFRASMLTISETTGTNLNNCSLFSHTQTVRLTNFQKLKKKQWISPVALTTRNKKHLFSHLQTMFGWSHHLYKKNNNNLLVMYLLGSLLYSKHKATNPTLHNNSNMYCMENAIQQRVKRRRWWKKKPKGRYIDFHH